MLNPTTLILSKNSSENEIRAYFYKVLELKQSNEQFPVDMDEVWPLVYGTKGDAVVALKAEFIQDIDYQVLRQNPKNPLGGRPTDIYKLTLSCLEYFIVRKVRPVFEVYRQVFHQTANILPQSEDDVILLAINTLTKRVEAHKQQLQIAQGTIQHQQEEIKTLAPKAAYTDEVLQSTSTYTMTQVAKELGMSAVALERQLKAKGVMFKQSGQWLLYAKYQGREYTKPRTHHYEHSDGTTGSNTITVWTEKGRAFVHSLFGSQTLFNNNQSKGE